MEIIFSRPRSRRAITPPARRPDPWNRTFRVDEDVGSHHIQHILCISTYRRDSVHLCLCTVCSTNSLSTWIERSQPRSRVQDNMIFSRLLYASPAWWGFTNVSNRDRLEGILTRSIRSGFCSENSPIFVALCEKSDNDLFSQIRFNHSHVLYGLLQSKPAYVYTVRERCQNFVLPDNSIPSHS